MHYYVEHWKPRDKWLALTPEDRGKFMFDFSPTLQRLMDAGIELVGYLVNEDSFGGRDFCFLRVWRMSEREFVQRIEEALEEAGWHEFFERGGGGGEIVTPQVAIPYLVNA